MSDLMERAVEAAARARAISALSRDLVEQSRRLRSTSGQLPEGPRFFVVHGEIQGRSVRASWFRGSLSATGTLLQRMHLLVALGEEFAPESGQGDVVAAGLAEPGPAMLTSVRACDRVRMVRFGPLDCPTGGRPARPAQAEPARHTDGDRVRSHTEARRTTAATEVSLVPRHG